MTEEEKKEEVAPQEVAPQVEEDYKDKYFRALAEIENTRKRLQREKIESQGYAIQNIVCDLLHPLDHLEQALKHAENAQGDVKNWALGFEMILNQFKQVLQDHGVVFYSARGELFDPHQHEAIETEETTACEPGTILEEYVRGYKLGNRVIRPARVKVATAPLPTNGQAPQAPQQEAQPPEINGGL